MNPPDKVRPKKAIVEEIPAPAMELAEEFVEYLNDSPSKYHAVQNAFEMLREEGFQELFMTDNWSLRNGGKYFVVHNDSTLYSFVIGRYFEAGNPFAIVVTHTDSPCLKVRPISNQSRHNYALVASSMYGGGHWLSYFDRDFKLAGRAFYRSQGKIMGQLVHIDRPICYVPNLAVHFRVPITDLDMENNFVPIMGLTNDSDQQAHRSELLSLVASEIGTNSEDIMELDLQLKDYNDAQLVGVNREFIAGQNQDNMVSTFASIKAIIRASKSSMINESNYVAMAVNCDHEEVGNGSAEGAETDTTKQILHRISQSQEKFSEAATKSFIMSFDVAHALHPNYAEQYEDRNRCNIFGGIAVKYSPKLNYTTNAYTSTVAKEVGIRANVPTQDFAVRNDATSGNTLGPEFSMKLGIPSVDVGTTMLAMHSIRELSGTIAISQNVDYMEEFFVGYGPLISNIEEIAS